MTYRGFDRVRHCQTSFGFLGGLCWPRAADGRLILGDIVQAIDGDEVSDLGDLQTVLDRYSPGDEVTVTILRENQTRDVRIQLF